MEKEKKKHIYRRIYLLLILCYLAFLVSLVGCGVKNDLKKPNPEFPRVYPVK